MTKRKLVTRKQLRLDYGIPYSIVHIRRLEVAGQFPSRVRLGQCRVAYVAEEIEEWIDKRIAARGVSNTTPSY